MKKAGREWLYNATGKYWVHRHGLAEFGGKGTDIYVVAIRERCSKCGKKVPEHLLKRKSK